MRRGLCAGVGAVSVVVGMQSIAAPGPTTYYSMQGATITEIDTLSGTKGVARDINNSGAIVGDYTSSAGWTHAFHFADGNFTNISIGATNALSSSANAINDGGEVVGQYTIWFEGTYEAAQLTQPFYWKAGVPFTPLAILTGWEFPHAVATSINNAGVIAGGAFGQTSTANGTCSGLIPIKWNSPTSAATPFKCPAHYGIASDINGSGSIVGNNVGTYPQQIFRYIGGATASVPTAPAILGLNVLSNGSAQAMNDNHNVVGHHFYTNPNASNPDAIIYRAFFWNGAATQSTLLGILSGGRFSKAYDVNEQRMVVGTSDANPYGIAFYQKAYIWHADFGLKELPSLPLPPNIITPGACEALAVNDRKSSNLVQAVGYCTVSGNKRPVRWDIDVRKYTSGVIVTP